MPTTRLRQIANDACFAALEKVDVYEHSRTEAWNSVIINHILRALISESAPSSSSSAPFSSLFKFAVNSTIIQHLNPRPTYSSTGTGTSDGGGSAGAELVGGRTPEGGAAAAGGRRGMHSACGAYWNNERDGMWSFKYETKGMDVVISVIWIAV